MHFIFITLLNNYDFLIIQKKEVFLYINLWKQLTYPLTLEAAIKQV